MAGNKQQIAADAARKILQNQQSDPDAMFAQLEELVTGVLRTEGYDDLLEVLDSAGLDS